MFLALKPTVIGTDFNMDLLTMAPLEIDDETTKVAVNFRGESALHAPEKPITYTFSIKKKPTLNLSDFKDYLDPSEKNLPPSTTSLLS